MFPENSDPIALTAQADIHRFCLKVIQPALAEFIPGPDSPVGIVGDIDTFLGLAQAATHNELCYEIRRAFGLAVGAMFERQIRSWMTSHYPGDRNEIESVSPMGFDPLIQRLRGIGFNDAGIANDVSELWLVTNAVRHGDGRSARDLAANTPQFWNHLSSAKNEASPPRRASNMRLTDSDLYRYTVAAMKFWRIAGASSLPGF